MACPRWLDVCGVGINSFRPVHSKAMNTVRGCTLQESLPGTNATSREDGSRARQERLQLMYPRPGSEPENGRPLRS